MLAKTQKAANQSGNKEEISHDSKEVISS